MSQPSDTSAISSPSAEGLLEIDLLSEQIANITVASSKCFAAEALSSANCHADDPSDAVDIGITLFSKTTVRTATGEKRADKKTDKKIMDKTTDDKTMNNKKTFKRKFNSDKEATSQALVSRVSASVRDRMMTQALIIALVASLGSSIPKPRRYSDSTDLAWTTSSQIPRSSKTAFFGMSLLEVIP
jgi:hypothetical protein